MADPEVLLIKFADDRVIPNNQRLPVVIMRHALDPDLSPDELGRIHAANGWGGGWTWSVFDYHHWHPNAHEALSVASGTAEIMLGGPKGQTFHVQAGDTLVLPAGTGHRRMSSSADFLVRGCYPEGQEARETRRGTIEERGDGVAEIAAVPLPVTDPVFGTDGPVMQAWRAKAITGV